MQEPTHILAGVIIQRSIQLTLGRRAAALVLTAVTAFLSHGLLDRLANATYHPPQGNFHDPFWIVFHSCVLVVTIAFLCVWWRRFKLGIFFAMLPDLDWVFIKGQDLFHVQIPFYRQPHMHHLLGLLFDKTPPFSLLKIPNHRQQHWACLYEVALIAVMLLTIHVLNNRPTPEHCEAGKT